jgi:hypothetical protein
METESKSAMGVPCLRCAVLCWAAAAVQHAGRCAYESQPAPCSEAAVQLPLQVHAGAQHIKSPLSLMPASRRILLRSPCLDLARRCGAPSTLQCPTCLKQGLAKAPYCSQECFKASALFAYLVAAAAAHARRLRLIPIRRREELCPMRVYAARPTAQHNNPLLSLAISSFQAGTFLIPAGGLGRSQEMPQGGGVGGRLGILHEEGPRAQRDDAAIRMDGRPETPQNRAAAAGARQGLAMGDLLTSKQRLGQLRVEASRLGGPRGRGDSASCLRLWRCP